MVRHTVTQKGGGSSFLWHYRQNSRLTLRTLAKSVRLLTLFGRRPVIFWTVTLAYPEFFSDFHNTFFFRKFPVPFMFYFWSSALPFLLVFDFSCCYLTLLRVTDGVFKPMLYKSSESYLRLVRMPVSLIRPCWKAVDPLRQIIYTNPHDEGGGEVAAFLRRRNGEFFFFFFFFRPRSVAVVLAASILHPFTA